MAIDLVTGGAGFIGSALVRELLAAGRTVRVLDDLSTGRRENLTGLDIELVQGDIGCPDTVERCMEDVRAVYHLAAIASVPRSVDEPAFSTRVNVEGFVNVLEAARRRTGVRVVFASSSAIYGNDGPFPKEEAHAPHPASPYALQKLVGEQYAAVYAELHGLQTVCLRLFNVFGPRQRPDSDYAAVIPAWIHALDHAGTLRVFGDGEQTRDFVFVEDVARAFRKGGELDAPGTCSIFNVATGVRSSLLDLVHALGSASGRKPDVSHEPARDGDVKHSWAAVAAAQRALGWHAQVDLRVGLQTTWTSTAA